MGLICNKIITKEEVLNKIEDRAIFEQYFGPFKLRRKAYSSPFRSDNNASCIFFKGTSSIKFRDLATNEDLDCFGFVAKLYGLTYREAVNRVWDDFGLGETKRKFVAPRIVENEEEESKETIIKVIPDKWSKSYLSYWADYGITEEILDKNFVYPVRNLYINDKEIGNYNLKMRFCYEVRWKDKVYYKIYTPHAENGRFKWVNNCPSYLLFGLNELRFTDTKLIIAKGRKEEMMLQKYFTNTISTQNESSASLRDKTIDYLKGKYKSIYYFSDSDEAGLRAAGYFEGKGLIPINLPDYYLKDHNIKDLGELGLKFGLEGVEFFLKSKNLL